ncbi:hypothetical protein DFS34DRAFT_652327 [Phlyctochytrium arcticum]|nr:hypothetical protein DFS34DRAFT_652327 [Phlyctochytrium arcticum]
MSWNQQPPGPLPMLPPASTSPWATAAPGAATPWKKHTTNDGKNYYYNTLTKQTTWETPDELKTPLERALSGTQWKEFTAADSGKKYYYNSNTKVTTWEVPAEIQAIIDASQTSAVVLASDALERKEEEKSLPPGPTAEAPKTVEFSTREEAERAFKKLLHDKGVTPAWTWDETLNVIIRHPVYRALKTLAERRATFEQYVEERRQEEEHRRKTKYANDRQALRKLFSETTTIHPRTHYRKVEELLQENPVFRAVPEKDREAIYAEYSEDMKIKEKEVIRETRKENVAKFERLLNRLTSEGLITLETTWEQVQTLYKAQPEYRADRKLQAMEPIDFLLTFVAHIGEICSKFQQKLDAEHRAVRRQERKNRDAFRETLLKLKENGTVHARSLWVDIYPLIKDDPSLQALLRQHGSSPMEIFGDVVMEILDEFRPQRREIEDRIKNLGITVTTAMTFEDFNKAIDGSALAHISPKNLELVYLEHLDWAVQHEKEDRRRMERKLRKKQDALKSVLKRLNPPLSLDSSWDSVAPRISDLEEYVSLEESQRLETFQKFIHRLKEKADKKHHRVRSDDEDEEGSIKEDNTDKRRKRSSRDERSSKSGRDKDRGDRDRDRDRKRHRRHRSPSSGADEDRSSRHKKKRNEDSDLEEGEERGSGRRGSSDTRRRPDVALTDRHPPPPRPDDSEEEGEVR